MRPLALLVAALVASSGFSQDVKPPTAGPPTLALAKATVTEGKRTIQLKHPRLVCKVEPKMVEEKVLKMVDGISVERSVKKPVQVTVCVTEWGTQLVNLADKGVSVTDLTGKELTGDRVTERLGKEVAVLVSTSGPVDPFYLQTTKAETLIVHLPAPPTPVAAPGASPVVPKAPAPAKAPEADDEVQSLLDLTNAERKKGGLPALKLNAKLQMAADAHSKNMAGQDKLAHELDNKGPSERLGEQKYSFRAMGENCAQGQRTPEEAVQAWMASPGHHQNLMNATYTEVGLGVAVSKSGVRYWTQVFATPLK
jgi:uncharacterized protein YkwD